jgi:uncharacterized protein (TIGR03905 family)
MRHSYITNGTCSSKITFDLDGDIVRNIEFTDGCKGNLKAIQKLTDGLTVDKIVSVLGGTLCGMKPTSCADQLAKAVQTAYSKNQ